MLFTFFGKYHQALRNIFCCIPNFHSFWCSQKTRRHKRPSTRCWFPDRWKNWLVFFSSIILLYKSIEKKCRTLLKILSNFFASERASSCSRAELILKALQLIKIMLIIVELAENYFNFWRASERDHNFKAARFSDQKWPQMTASYLRWP